MTKDNCEKTSLYIRTYWPIFLFILVTVAGAYFALEGKVDTNEDDIIGMKKDITQILETQRMMRTDATNNNKQILEAIKGINDGD